MQKIRRKSLQEYIDVMGRGLSEDAVRAEMVASTSGDQTPKQMENETRNTVFAFYLFTTVDSANITKISKKNFLDHARTCLPPRCRAATDKSRQKVLKKRASEQRSKNDQRPRGETQCAPVTMETSRPSHETNRRKHTTGKIRRASHRKQRCGTLKLGWSRVLLL